MTWTKPILLVPDELDRLLGPTAIPCQVAGCGLTCCDMD